MRILLASPFLAYPDTNGAKARILAFMRMLIRAGHEVHFAYMGIDKADPAKCASFMSPHCASFTDLRDESYPWADPGVEGYEIDDWISEQQAEKFKKLHDTLNPDITVVNYIFLSRLLEGLSSIKVIDLHDRLARADQYEAISEPPKFFYTTEARELASIKRADIALCIQENEKNYFERVGIPVFTFGHILPRAYLDRRYTDLKRIGYLGAYNIFNIHALKELLPRFEALVQEYPGLRLCLGGGICNAFESFPDFVELEGYVPSLTDFYKKIDLALNPTIAGTGLKIKTVEALSFGLPLVSTRVGMDGLPVKSHFHVAETMDDVVKMIGQIKENDFKELTKLSNLSKLTHTEYSETQKNTIRAFLSFCEQIRKSTCAGAPMPVAETRTHPKTILDIDVSRSSERMLHVLNPFHAPESSDNYLAQPITYQSMSDAIDFARNYVQVDVLNVHMPNEQPVTHPVFTYTQALTESSKDYLPDYPKSLPLLRDILSTAAKYSEYDWLIYTNVDIALTPSFYRAILEYIDDGHDAIIINRRTITKKISARDQIANSYSQIGRKHPGFDCFVFRREMVEKFQIFDTLVGVHLIGRILIWNILKHARSVIVEKECHLTFHIGDDVPSKDVGEVSIIAHNFNQAEKFWEQLKKEEGALSRLHESARAANVGDALKFGVGKLVTPKVHRPSEEIATSSPVHFHGHFRCSSTFLFRDLRRDPGNMCFYEPFHEDIETFSKDNLAQKKALHLPVNFHKEHDGEWFFAETEPLLVAEGRIPGFRADFGTRYFGDNRPNSDIETYVQLLIDYAYKAGRRPVLQFNRSGLRLEYFTRTFPKHHHFFLLRNLEDQWSSYLRFMRGGRRGFLRSMVACLSQGRKGDRLRALNDLIPLFRLEGTHNLHERYNKYYDLYTLEELYVCFYYMWMVSLLDAVSFDVPILQMSKIGLDPALQARTDSLLAKAGLAVDWSHLATDTYPETFLCEEVKRNCEAIVNLKLLEMYDESVFAKLTNADFPCHALNVTENSKPPTGIRKYHRSITSMDGIEVLTQAQNLAESARELEVRQGKISGIVNEPHRLPLIMPGLSRLTAKDGFFDKLKPFSFNFTEPESTHVWTVGKLAGFAIRIPYRAKSLSFRIFMNANEELIEKHALFSIVLNGQRILQDVCQEWRWFDVSISPVLAAAGRNGTLCFLFDSQVRVENMISGKRLFFALSEMEIDYKHF